MRQTTMGLAALGMTAVFAAAAPARAQHLITLPVPHNNRIVADLWLRRISNDQNLDGDRTTYWVTIYRKHGPYGEEHRIVGPRLVANGVSSTARASVPRLPTGSFKRGSAAMRATSSA
jgi:hypothetical protein